MRYLRLILLVIFVYWTYQGMHKPVAISVYTHSVIQEDLRNIIRMAIKDALPDATNIRFAKMSTEGMGDDQVVASFVYGYNTESESGSDYYEIEGRALLNRYPSEEVLESWSLDQIVLDKEAIEFQDPILIEVE